MTKSVIEEVFFASLERAGGARGSAEYWRLTGEIVEIFEILCGELASKQRELIERLDKLISQKESEIAAKNYKAGFRAGAKILTECLKEE